MKGSANFIMTWPELKNSIECQPREDGVHRWIYDWYLSHMPIRYVQLHAALTGGVMYTWTQVSATLPELANNKLEKIKITKARPGMGHLSYNITNGLAGGRIAHIGLFYGPCFEDMDTYISFQVVERDMDKLYDAGAKIWNAFYKTKQIITAELTVKS